MNAAEDRDIIHHGFRIVEMKDGNPHTLFHGIQGENKRTKQLITGEWLEADVKQVRDGGQYYTSGFHFMYDLDTLIKYMASFTAPRELHVINILAKDVYPKPTNSNVFLSRFMFIDPRYQTYYSQC